MTATIIDSHQHVWDLTRARYEWLGPDSPQINRTIDIEEVLPAFARSGVNGSVLVQSADNAEDTQLMIDTAAAHPEVVAIVAYVPLDRPDVAAAELERLRVNPLIVGVRNLIHNQPDPDWLLRPEVDEGLGVLERAGVTFDLVAVLPRHLELVPILVERHPRLKIVIDHLSKPPVGLDDPEPWWTLIGDAAASSNVFGKVSGLYSATDEPGSWTPELVRPFVDRAIEVFGVERLMYGGDWPVSMLAGGYDRVWAGLAEVFATLTAAERDRILGGTALSFYGIPDVQVGSAARRAK